MGGLKFKVTEAFKIGFDLAYVNATAGMSQFRFTKAEEWAAPKPMQNYDMSKVHTYSDLDTTRFESDLWAKFGFGKSLFLYGDWRYVDYADDAPYLYDTSGKISWYTLSLGWSF
jgi:hypothetical protein